jgi:predicted  nucleic acid-binding Zn-ribbon protein
LKAAAVARLKTMATQTVTKYAATFIPHVAPSGRPPCEIKLNPQVSALEAAKEELFQIIKAAVCETLQQRISGLKKDMIDLKADNRKLYMRIDKLRKENDELRTSQVELHMRFDELRTSNDELRASNDELRASNDELRTSNDELRPLVYKVEKDIIELKAYNKHLREKDFLDQLRQCCYEYQEYMKERTTLKTIAELHQAMWNRWPAEDKDSLLHKDIFAAELRRFADRLEEEHAGLGSKARAKQASDVLTGKVAFALSIRADSVYSHFLDQDFLIQAVNEFDKVKVGNQKVSFVDKPSWIALIKHIFEITPSLQPFYLNEESYLLYGED